MKNKRNTFLQNYSFIETLSSFFFYISISYMKTYVIVNNNKKCY